VNKISFSYERWAPRLALKTRLQGIGNSLFSNRGQGEKSEIFKGSKNIFTPRPHPLEGPQIWELETFGTHT